jgi:hypothetical protein
MAEILNAVYQELDAQQRLSKLRNEANKVRHREYAKDLTPAELDKLGKKQNALSIELADANDRKKIAIDEAKSLQSQFDSITNVLKYKKIFKFGECFEFVDKATKKVLVYCEEGILRDTKDATDNELQTQRINFEDAENIQKKIENDPKLQKHKEAFHKAVASDLNIKAVECSVDGKVVGRREYGENPETTNAAGD